MAQSTSSTAKASGLDALRKQWIAGAIAGMTESVVTMPFEVMKTRLQVSQNASWKDALLAERARSGLVRSAFAGLSPMLVQTSMKVGIRFAAYEAIRTVVTPNPMVAGFGAGAIEALVWITPTERIKTLRINTGTAASEHRTMLGSVKSLLVNQGVRGLWRGGTATVARNATTGGVRFWLVETLKKMLSTMTSIEPSMQTAIAGFMAGGMTTVLNQPLDVIKTRMSSDQVAGETPRFKSNWHCAKVVWTEGGLRAFTAGLGARMMKISIGQAVIFAVYDQVTKVL